MIFPLQAAGILLAPTVLLAILVWVVLLALQKPVRRFLRAMLWLHLGLFALHLFVTFPFGIGWVGSRVIGTRPQERSYQGPRLQDGVLLVQDWDSLAREAKAGKPEVAPAVAAAAAARQQRVASSDGVSLRTFRIEAVQEPPRAVVVMVHGLFRSAMELEPVAAMLHELGCECWLVDLRNHGGSSRAPFTAGFREADDVVAVARHVRAQPGRERTPMLVFGVSLGTAAVSLAMPRLPDAAGLVLDAPMEDLRAAAARMLDFHRPGDPRSNFRVVEPWRSSILAWLEWWSSFQLADVRPQEVLKSLPADLPVLVIGGGDDDRMPEATVRALFAQLPMPAARKELWIRPGSGHGRVWHDDPAGYRQRLQALLERLRR